MDPLTAAITLAQIVSLISDYAAGKGSRDVLDIREFAEWTATHGHADLMKAIEQNQGTVVSIKSALAEGRDELLGRLAALDERLAAVSAGLGPFDDLAKSLRPDRILSEQARAILCEFEKTQAVAASEQRLMTGERPHYRWLFLNAKVPGRLNIEDERFYQDDVDRLIALRLIAAERTPKGQRMFRMTRSGSELAKSLTNS